MKLEQALSEISELGDRLDMHVFFGTGYTMRRGNSYTWDVQMEWQDEGTKVKVEAKGASLEEAVLDAWGRLRSVADTGLPPGALVPAALPAPAPEEDEIPF